VFDGAALRDPEQLTRLIGLIDRRIAALLDAILHHPRFQKLESLWRSVRYLVDGLPRGANVRIRILTVSWRELSRDFDRSPEFDASNLFRKVYSEAFGTAGGQPFGLLVGDYEIHPWPNPDHPYSDPTALAAISEVAAAAFSPFITGAHPSLLGLRDWSELERPVPLRPIYEQLEFTKWNAFREPEDRQFLGIALPPMLVRLPYMGHEAAVRGLCYRENVHGPDASRMLWGNAAFPFAAAVLRSFAETEWLASIRGVTKHVSERGVAEGVAETGGLVASLPTAFRDADPYHVCPVSPTIVTITDEMEHDLSELGFIPLASCHNSEYCAFYSNRSVRRVPRLDSAWATQNATVAAQLQYVLCVSRFAHFLKIIARDMIGSYVDADSLERFLNGWLRSYVTQERDAPPDVRARYPLREAAVRVREVPGRPGAYTSVVHLLPHCELDELRGAVTLRFPMQADVS
jgi:type VI secretion system ImpC/EvpB family protein